MQTETTCIPEQIIRPYQDSDEADVVGVWHRACRAVYTFLPNFEDFTLDVAAEVFRNVIRPAYTLWVGVDSGRVVAYMAINGSFIDRLYVDPSAWRKGWGRRFVQFAKGLSPAGLELYTHQENHAARALYESEGFKAVKFGISPPPESAPDVEYHWRPGG